MSSKKDITSERTRRKILELLKRRGALDAASLAGEVGISAMAIRQHLYQFQEEGLVDFEEEPRPMGRPAKLWGLTGKADSHFPDAHASLTVDLIDSITGVFGQRGMEKLLARRVEQQIDSYRGKMPGGSSLERKLKTLVEIRTAEGYMAELQENEEGNGWILVENHCPICAAATNCLGLCSAELEVFQAVLGEDVRIERTEHLLEGARRCAYEIEPTEPRLGR